MRGIGGRAAKVEIWAEATRPWCGLGSHRVDRAVEQRGTGKPAMRISHADFAGFLIDTVEKDAWIRQTLLVWNSRG